MDLEKWVVDLLEEIKEASDKGESYTIHLVNDYVKEVAEAYKKTKWVEIY